MKILKKTVKMTFWSVLILGILTIITYTLDPFYIGRYFAYLLLILPIIVFPIKLIYEIYYFRSYHYSDNKQIFVLRKGVFTVTDVTVPYDKIQNIFVNRDIFDRIFGLYDVHLSTVGFISQMELHIDGVSMKNSENLKTLFTERIS